MVNGVMVRKTLIRTLAVFAILAAGISPACKSFKGASAAGGDTGKKDYPDEPEVTFQSLDGRNVSLGSFKGKVVLVNFWATWCEPCKAEIPGLIDFQRKYWDKGFTILGVAMDDEGKKVVEPFVQGEKFDVDGQKVLMNYPIMIGNDAIANKFGGIIGFPTSVLISRDGKVIKRFIGLVNMDSLKKDIQGLI
jgi:thiol-disulfide isomerase/thioredoxin